MTPLSFEEERAAGYTHDMSAGGVLIERVSEVTDELVAIMARLLPQLSSTAARCSSLGWIRDPTRSSARSHS
jgi:hypothetical protein